MKKIEDLDRALCAIAVEIEEFLTSGTVKALAAVIITNDGETHLRMRYIEGGKLPLVAGAAILQRDILDTIGPRPRDRDDDD